MKTTTSLSLVLEQETLADLERAFAPRVGARVVFLPGLEGAGSSAIGARCRVDLKLKGGDVALTLHGRISWRYPADAVPPGREAGVGLLVEDVSAEHRALLERMRAREGAGEGARAPGSRLPSRLFAPERLRHERPRQAPSVEERAPDDAGERAHGDVADDFEVHTSDFVLAEYEGRLLAHRAAVDDDARAERRPVPPPPGYPSGPVARPPLTGLYFGYDYKGGDSRRVKFQEAFAWPEVGTLRPSKGDMRTWPPGSEPPGDFYDDYRSPWDEITDAQRAAHGQEVSDPGRRVTDVVKSAARGLQDVDDALAASPARPPPMTFADDNGAEVTDTDAHALATESSEAPESTLPIALRVRVDGGRAQELFAAGVGVPTSRTLRLVRSNGAATVRVAVLEGGAEGEGRHLGTVRVRAPKSGGEARFDLRADGVLEVRSPDDGSVSERWRTSWAAPVEYPKSRRRRGWLRRLLGL